MYEIRMEVWSADSELNETDKVSSGKLWASVGYYPNSGNLFETRDGKRWPNEYRDEVTYRDRKEVPLAEFFARVEYYAKRGYLLRFNFGN